MLDERLLGIRKQGEKGFSGIGKDLKFLGFAPITQVLSQKLNDYMLKLCLIACFVMLLAVCQIKKGQHGAGLSFQSPFSYKTFAVPALVDVLLVTDKVLSKDWSSVRMTKVGLTLDSSTSKKMFLSK
jgi:hypothetical protein